MRTARIFLGRTYRVLSTPVPLAVPLPKRTSRSTFYLHQGHVSTLVKKGVSAEPRKYDGIPVCLFLAPVVSLRHRQLPSCGEALQALCDSQMSVSVTKAPELPPRQCRPRADLALRQRQTQAEDGPRHPGTSQAQEYSYHPDRSACARDLVCLSQTLPLLRRDGSARRPNHSNHLAFLGVK